MEKNTYLSTNQQDRLEIWGGVECTINRVGNRFHDQLLYSGHYDRETDLDLIASLGIKAIRFPILWERHQPQLNSNIDLRWAKKRLALLNAHGIEPIAGLLHHGSGPVFTDLADPCFPYFFSRYASEVAKQFPYIQYYTPVNEPLTTARFSGLYGHWYPHQRDSYQFITMLLNQMKGTVMAMERIRKFNPDAVLVQTEDIGKTYSTDMLKYQAEFENERRWLTFDLLCGKVNKDHSLWDYLLWLGVKESDLSFFTDNPCPPGIIGVNNYVTSERFLDENVNNYPGWKVGGNGKHEYVDIEAIRVAHDNESGLRSLLKETSERYQLPIAVTEVQLGCHREHQLRWFREVLNTCTSLNSEGVNIKAVTAWSLFGSYGWNKLVTEPKGNYESGVFDLSSGEPRPTALYHFIKSVNNNEERKFDVADEPGWWQLDNRFIQPKNDLSFSFSNSNRSRPVLIIGKTGTLGSAFARICEQRGINYRLLSRQDADIVNKVQVMKAVDKHKPWAIINTAGYVRVDDAENEPDKCFRENKNGPKVLANVCREQGLKFMTYSSDLVFDGDKSHPYLETDEVSPLNVYGRSKAEGEKEVKRACPDALIIRTSAFFGPWDKHNFVYNVLQSLSRNQGFEAVSDVTISPTYVPDLVHTCLDLMIDDEKDTWHVANDGTISWADLAKEVAKHARYESHLVIPKEISSFNLKASRPKYSVLNSHRGIKLPKLEHALERFFSEVS